LVLTYVKEQSVARIPHQPPELEDLVTGAEIARRLGVSRARAHQLSGRPDFPRPIGRVGNYVVWRWSDVKGWLPSVDRPPVVEIYGWTDPPHVRGRKVWYQVVVGETKYPAANDHAAVYADAERLREELGSVIIDRSDRGSGYLAGTLGQ
jgi:predicted DNA-binding transcriptional regulator AlpA